VDRVARLGDDPDDLLDPHLVRTRVLDGGPYHEAAMACGLSARLCQRSTANGCANAGSQQHHRLRADAAPVQPVDVRQPHVRLELFEKSAAFQAMAQRSAGHYATRAKDVVIGNQDVRWKTAASKPACPLQARAMVLLEQVGMRTNGGHQLCASLAQFLDSLGQYLEIGSAISVRSGEGVLFGCELPPHESDFASMSLSRTVIDSASVRPYGR
jgi:hypothetical protein